MWLQGFAVFNTLIHANHIVNKDKIASTSLTDEEMAVSGRIAVAEGWHRQRTKDEMIG